jgi:hypothetical protein
MVHNTNYWANKNGGLKGHMEIWQKQIIGGLKGPLDMWQKQIV